MFRSRPISYGSALSFCIDRTGRRSRAEERSCAEVAGFEQVVD